jgi:CDP-diacylglycerol--serine O-phosphatidyltransferase
LTDEGRNRSARSFLYDRANLVTLAGLLCGVSSIYLSALSAHPAAAIALLWALFCDWFDGPIARRMKNRTDVDRAFGSQLDSLADLVCGGVGPGMLLLSVSGFDPWFLPGAFALAIAGALRLAHFNVLGDAQSYSGLPIDTNIIVVTALFAFRESLGHTTFPWLLYIAVVILAVLNVASFRMPKAGERWCYVVAAYVVGMTAILSARGVSW